MCPTKEERERVIAYFFDPQSMKTEFFLCLIYIAIAAIFKSSHFPESIFPGRYNLLGSSHQIFHIFVFLSLNEQYKVTQQMSRLKVYESDTFLFNVLVTGLVFVVLFIAQLSWWIFSVRSLPEIKKEI